MSIDKKPTAKASIGDALAADLQEEIERCEKLLETWEDDNPRFSYRMLESALTAARAGLEARDLTTMAQSLRNLISFKTPF